MTAFRLNPVLNEVQPSATIAINELSQKLISEGKEIFKLGFGQSPFPVPRKIIDTLKQNAHQKNYMPTKGLDILRLEVANYFQRNYTLITDKEDVIVGPGSKELLYDFQLAYDFKELLLPSPSWVSYEPQAILTGHKVAWLDTEEANQWKITPETISAHCNRDPEVRRVLILNYPSNPLGITYSEDELKLLAKTFRKYQIIVIADEIYGEVHHTGQHCTIASFYPEGTIISTGLSKWAGAGGWRFGIFIFPSTLRFILEGMAVIASETFTSVSAPIQYAAVCAYQGDESIEKYLKNSRKILKIVSEYMFNSLTEIGISMPKPEGGFYLYPNFAKWEKELKSKGIYTSKELCNALLYETGVALLPGEAFGHPKENLSARLSYVDFDGEKLLRVLDENPGIELNNRFVEVHCPRIVEACQKIKLWANFT